MIILKIGGGATINLEATIQDLAILKQNNPDEKIIIIHGANAVRDELASKLQIKKEVITSVSGYDSVLSNKDIIDLQMMAYAGLMNKRIVELCQQSNINAIGLSGLDGKLIQGKRNRGIKTKIDGKFKLLKDLAGKPKAINTKLLTLLLNANYTPILCVPIIDEKNIAINSENDDIVRVLTQELKLKENITVNKIIMLIEAPGFLDNKDDPTTLVKSITKEELQARTQQVEGRMKRKMLSLTKLFEAGASTVHISDGRTQTPITDIINGKGTIIQ